MALRTWSRIIRMTAGQPIALANICICWSMPILGIAFYWMKRVLVISSISDLQYEQLRMTLQDDISSIEKMALPDLRTMCRYVRVADPCCFTRRRLPHISQSILCVKCAPSHISIFTLNTLRCSTKG